MQQIVPSNEKVSNLIADAAQTAENEVTCEVAVPVPARRRLPNRDFHTRLGNVIAAEGRGADEALAAADEVPAADVIGAAATAARAVDRDAALLRLLVSRRFGGSGGAVPPESRPTGPRFFGSMQWPESWPSGG